MYWKCKSLCLQTVLDVDTSINQTDVYQGVKQGIHSNSKGIIQSWCPFSGSLTNSKKKRENRLHIVEMSTIYSSGFVNK